MLNSKLVDSISFTISSIPPDIGKDESMEQVIDIIYKSLNLYFVGLFLVDPIRKTVILRAGSGEIGRQLVSRGWTLPLTGKNFWANVIQSNEVRLNNWARQEAFGCSLPTETQLNLTLTLESREEYFPSPLLPNTKWQLLLPLQSEQQVIGILEIQSDDQTIQFVSEDIRMFILLSNQIAANLKQRQ